jgi:hypothetical protein
MTNEITTINQIADPLKQSVIFLLALHGGGLISCAAFTAAADVIFEKMMGKTHPIWLLLIYSVVVGIVYRGYTTDWINHITRNQSLAVSLVGIGYGILAVGIYFAILKPLKGGAVKFLKAKFKIK